MQKRVAKMHALVKKARSLGGKKTYPMARAIMSPCLMPWRKMANQNQNQSQK
jgi:hypothetical protein